MNCNECTKEISEPNKFCPHCGAEIKDSMSAKLHSMTKSCAKAWFRIGYLHALASKDKGIKEIVEDFEKKLKKISNEMWEWYEEMTPEI